jgi:hypothetical protein
VREATWSSKTTVICILSHQVKPVEGIWQLSSRAPKFCSEAINAVTNRRDSKIWQVGCLTGYFLIVRSSKYSPVHVPEDDL